MAPETSKTTKNIWVRFDRADYEPDAWESLCRGMRVDPETQSFIAEVDRTSVRRDEYSPDGELLTTNWPEVSRFLTGNLATGMSPDPVRTKSRRSAGKQATGPSAETWNQTLTYLIDNIIRILQKRAPEELPVPAGSWMDNVCSLESTLLGPTVTCAIPRIQLLERLKELRHNETRALRAGDSPASTALENTMRSVIKLLEQLIGLYSSNAKEAAALITEARQMHYNDVVDPAGRTCEQCLEATCAAIEQQDDAEASTVIPYNVLERLSAGDLTHLMDETGLTIDVIEAPTGTGTFYNTKVEWLGKQVVVTQVMPPIAVVKKMKKVTASD